MTIPLSFSNWIEDLVTAVQQDKMPFLQHLELKGTCLAQGEDGIAALIRGCRILRSFKAYFVRKGIQEIVQALKINHSETLEELQLFCSIDLTTSLIVTLLTSFPNLQVLDLMCSESPWISSAMVQAQKRFREISRRGEAVLKTKHEDTKNLLDSKQMLKRFIPCWESLRVLRIRCYPFPEPPSLENAFRPCSEEEDQEEEEEEEIFPKKLYEGISELKGLEELRLGLTLPYP